MSFTEVMATLQRKLHVPSLSENHLQVRTYAAGRVARVLQQEPIITSFSLQSLNDRVDFDGEAALRWKIEYQVSYVFCSAYISMFT